MRYSNSIASSLFRWVGRSFTELRSLLPISALVLVSTCGCNKPNELPKVYKANLTTIPRKDSPKKGFPIPAPGSSEMEVWNRELSLFQAKNISTYMSFWDDDFVGWPDYSEYPVRKPDIEASASNEFRGLKPQPPLPLPTPLAVTVFGDVAVTQYFWPEADESSPVRYRTTHTWKKGPLGWRIISGMACEVPRTTTSSTTK